MTTPTDTPATQFGILRHGETAWNRTKKIQGITDIKLTAKGRDQALAWGAKLARGRWDHILSSDLQRARTTARLINRTLEVPIHQDSGLQEQDWGQWTGTTIRQLRTQHPETVAVQEAAGWDFRPPGGESRRQVLQRSRAALIRAAQRWPASNILVVTHTGVLKCLFYDLTGRKFLPSEPALLRPYHLHRINTDAAGLAIQRINALVL